MRVLILLALVLIGALPARASMSAADQHAAVVGAETRVRNHLAEFSMVWRNDPPYVRVMAGQVLRPLIDREYTALFALRLSGRYHAAQLILARDYYYLEALWSEISTYQGAWYNPVVYQQALTSFAQARRIVPFA